MPQKTTPRPWTVHHRMTDCVTFEGQYGQENLFLQNLDGYFACQNPEDAKLIASAPELLETCIQARAVLRTVLADITDETGIAVVKRKIELLSAVISKATE